MLKSMNSLWEAKQKGFTIVELLIVIVVIGILAAISIVAYNGIRTRANNTQTIDAVKQFVKAYNLYAADNGGYPQESGCLGEGYPANVCLAQDGSGFCFGVGGATNPLINVALKPYMNNKVPSVSQQKIPCGSTTYIGAYGAFTGIKTVAIFMMLSGDQTCPPMSPDVASSTKSYATDMTFCRYNLATL